MFIMAGEIKVFDFKLNNVYFHKEGIWNPFEFYFDLTLFEKRILPRGDMRDIVDIYIILRWPTYDPAYWEQLTRDLFYIYGSDKHETIVQFLRHYHNLGFVGWWRKDWRYQRFVIQTSDTHCCSGNNVILDVYFDGKSKFTFKVSGLIPPVKVIKVLDPSTCEVKANLPGKFELLPSKKVIRLKENQKVIIQNASEICYLGL